MLMLVDISLPLPFTLHDICCMHACTCVCVMYAAIASARAAWPSWSALSAEERADWIDKIANEVERRAETLAMIESMDTGKPLAYATTPLITCMHQRSLINMPMVCVEIVHRVVLIFRVQSPIFDSLLALFVMILWKLLM
jgi:hypothetical protein